MKRILCLILCILLLAPAYSAGDVQVAANANLSKIYPVDDSPIDGHPDSRAINVSHLDRAAISGTFQPHGYERFYYMKFDLSGIETDKKLKSALVSLKAIGITGGAEFAVFKSENDDWSGSEITYNNADKSWVSIANKDKYMLDSISDFLSGSTRAFDITSFVREELQGDKTVTIILRDVSTRGGNFNPYSTFHTTASPDAASHPYLSLEFYEEGDAALELSEYTFKNNGQDITNTGLVAGNIESTVNIEHNFPTGDAASITVLYTLCYGSEENYRVREYKVVTGVVPAGENKSFSETVNVPNDPQKKYFIKVFMWNAMEEKQVRLPSFSFTAK